MRPLGWAFLIVSLASVWTLTIWCFYRVLSGNGKGDRSEGA